MEKFCFECLPHNDSFVLTYNIHVNFINKENEFQLSYVTSQDRIIHTSKWQSEDRTQLCYPETHAPLMKPGLFPKGCLHIWLCLAQDIEITFLTGSEHK